jgi:hypothetical protein
MKIGYYKNTISNKIGRVHLITEDLRPACGAIVAKRAEFCRATGGIEAIECTKCRKLAKALA